MIIFTHDTGYIWKIMFKFPKKTVRILNLSSLYSGYQSVTNLITKVAPINNTNMPHNLFVHSVEFDIQYANALMNNPEMFDDLMQIMIPCYEGEVVVVLVQHDVFRDAVMESLIKFIQQRYGYNCWIMNDQDDLECIDETSFSTYGLMALDDDIRKHDELCARGVCGKVVFDREFVE